jgi:hypothetical protein
MQKAFEGADRFFRSQDNLEVVHGREGLGREFRQGGVRKGSRARSRGSREEEKVTRMSESKTRSVAAIGNSRVIPANAGIQRRSRVRQDHVTRFPRPRERRAPISRNSVSG